MAADQRFDHSGRRTRWFDSDLGWCVCSVCVHLPLYVGQKTHAPTPQTLTDPDPVDSFGCNSTDPVPGPDGWELGGEGG